jgi:hypothetical protein
LAVPASHSPDFIRYIAKTYKDDFNGYREDVLGMRPAEWQNEVGNSLMKNKRTAVSSGLFTGFSRRGQGRRLLRRPTLKIS